MATLVISMFRMAVGFLCNFSLPMRIIMLFILPLPAFIIPINQILYWLLFFLPVHYTNNSIKNEKGEKDFKTSFKTSYMIYHGVFVFVYAVILYSICSANALIDASPLGDFV